MGSKDGERGNDTHGDQKYSLRWMSWLQSSITCYNALKSTFMEVSYFLKSVTLYQSWTSKKNPKSICDLTFCDSRFRDMMPFFLFLFSTLRIFVRKWKVHFTSSCFQTQMMPVAKATAITQVTDPSCELRHVIGLSTRGVYRLSILIGWLVGRGRSPGRQRLCRKHWFNRLASVQTVGTRTHIYIHTHICVYIHTQTAGGSRCKGKFGPVGVTSVGASVCVCNIMLSRRGVAGSNRSTPRSRPRWVISHSLGNSPYTLTHTHTHREQNMAHMACVQHDWHTNAKLQTRGGHESTVHTHPISFLHSYKVIWCSESQQFWLIRRTCCGSTWLSLIRNYPFFCRPNLHVFQPLRYISYKN